MRGVAVVVARRAVVVEGQQADDLDARGDEAAEELEHLRTAGAFVEVADQDQDRLAGRVIRPWQ